MFVEGARDSHASLDVVGTAFLGNEASVLGGALYVQNATDVAVKIANGSSFLDNSGPSAAVWFAGPGNSVGGFVLSEDTEFGSTAIFSQVSVNVAPNALSVSMGNQNPNGKAPSFCAQGSSVVANQNPSAGSWQISCSPCQLTEYQLRSAKCAGVACKTCSADATCYGAQPGGQGAPTSANEG